MLISELRAGLAAVDQACAYLLEEYARFEVIPNAPSDITTHADRQAQEILLKALRSTFPGDGFCAEEATESAANTARTGSRLWIIDPIDGTRGFARKNGEFSVMVAFLKEGELEVGIVAQPVFGRLTYAQRGEGCWRRDEGDEPVRCHVTSIANPSDAALTQSRSKEGSTPSPLVEAICPARIVETYSAGVKLALVARGEADIYLNDYLKFHDWDIAAGQILVTEAGGAVTGLRGETLRYGLPGAAQRQGLLATNGALHEVALTRLRGIAL